MTAQALKKTALYERHLAAGGKMVDFGGWEMPLWYNAGAVKEHMAPIVAAGLFDTSHMAVVLGDGPGSREPGRARTQHLETSATIQPPRPAQLDGADSEALLKFLDYAVTRDLRVLASQRAGYGLILDEKGWAVDDAVIYPLAGERFGLVVNAGMGGRVIEHLRGLPGGENFQWTDLSGRLAKLDLQGPACFHILKNFVAEAGQVFAHFPYFSFAGDFDLARSQVRLTDGTPILLSRTGYTGELGFEIFLPPERAASFWAELLAAGADAGLIPCGLAARDSLRTGAVLALSHQDIGPWPFVNNPWPWALPPRDAAGRFSKNFVGARALDPALPEHTLPFVGFDPRKVEAHEARVLYEGRDIGRVLTAVADMAIGRLEGRVLGWNSPERPSEWSPKGLVCGFIKVDRALSPGAAVTLKDARRELKVEITADIRPHRGARSPLR